MNIRIPYLNSFVMAAITMVCLSGCGNRKTNDPAANNTDVPPSVEASAGAGPVIVRLSPEEARELKISTQTIVSEFRTLALAAPGTVFPAPNHIGIISAPVEGRVVSLPVQEGSRVSRGQVVLELESLAYGTLVADYLQALAEVELQTNQLTRMQKLAEKKISPEAELEQVRSSHVRALASQNAAYAKLKTVGVSDREIDALRNAERINPRLQIHSPINGVIDSHKVELGQAVAANETIGSVISLDQVMVKAYLAPEDGARVQPGDTVRISHRLTGEEPLTAWVTSINPGLDETNRSVVVNILVRQEKSLLKPGDNVRTEIQTAGKTEEITVSMDAVTYDNNDAVVFVKVSGDRYEMRKIVIGRVISGHALVRSGLQAGEQVATGQVFSLKALSRFKLISEE